MKKVGRLQLHRNSQFFQFLNATPNSSAIREMCPLRLILIFLSATLAGFFLVRNFKSRPSVDTEVESTNADDHNSSSRFSKARGAIQSGFWTCVDMASGRYLWRHLVSSKTHST